MSTMIEQFRQARRVGVPLVAIVTPDPAATIRSLCTGDDRKVCWDVVRGLHEPPVRYGLAAELCPGGVDETKNSPVGFLEVCHNLPPRSVGFMLLADRWMRCPNQGAIVTQGIWNLRDTFKASGRTLVMLCSGGELPVELKHDVLALEEPLPDRGALKGIVTSIVKAAKSASDDFVCGDLDRDAAVERLGGLSSFAAEQASAMALRPTHIDLDDLWHRKRKMIEATPGLAVYGGSESFGDLGGLANVKAYMGRLLTGQRHPNAIVFVDEIEKALAGASGDTSGVSQGQLQALLVEMQDQQYQGCLLIGHPGSGKSALAKAAGNEAGIPTIQMDLAGMKGSLVGQTEGAVRDALRVIRGVSGGKALWLATCNRLGALPPELRRRFTGGCFMFDLPDQSERDVIWSYYLGKYKLSKRLERPNDVGWTGAEIRTCCDNAWALGLSLVDAAEYVVPVSRSAAAEVESLRRLANGRFISASYKGVYRWEPNQAGVDG